jgi:hypothetical protein
MMAARLTLQITLTRDEARALAALIVDSKSPLYQLAVDIEDALDDRDSSVTVHAISSEDWEEQK